ncbi:DUF2268 domain-containing protein [Herbidospora yilanensis]|uniref:DUF2268 domain-containing protein n=1 Tax=Herbidospora yilanensis TaxID=354426 RepID=UPI00078265AA|nr:DUF2268 domain-containing putative Zn-dependent protease [Herbidospora yilanensis]
MKLNVIDTVTRMREIFATPLPGRPGALGELLQPMADAMPWLDTGALADFHHRGSGFRADRDDDRYLPALDRLDGVLGRIEAELHRAWDHQAAAVPGIGVADTVNVLLVLGDPDDAYLTETSHGYFGMGGIPGWIHLTVWPTEESLAAIASCAVHEFHHNVRYANVTWDPPTVRLGEQIVSEGLADAFVAELGGTPGYWADSLPEGEFEGAYRKIVDNLSLTGMHNFSAYIHGDAAAARFGGTPVGLPAMAGYPVGRRIVEAHLAATGLTAAQSTALPSAEIIANAGL